MCMCHQTPKCCLASHLIINFGLQVKCQGSFRFNFMTIYIFISRSVLVLTTWRSEGQTCWGHDTTAFYSSCTWPDFALTCRCSLVSSHRIHCGLPRVTCRAEFEVIFVHVAKCFLLLCLFFASKTFFSSSSFRLSCFFSLSFQFCFSYFSFFFFSLYLLPLYVSTFTDFLLLYFNFLPGLIFFLLSFVPPQRVKYWRVKNKIMKGQCIFMWNKLNMKLICYALNKL